MLTERAPKKRKTRSGCTGIELTSAFLVLQKFRETITTTELDDEGSELEVEIDPTEEQDALSQLDNLLQWMESKIKSSTKVHKFSAIQSDVLSDLQVLPGPLLYLKPDWTERVADSRLTGSNQFMTSENFHSFLNMLIRLVARPSEASARTWVDAFLYRASAMMPDDKRMTLNVEYNITPVTVPTASGADVLLVGYMDYTVVTSHPLNAAFFLNNPGARDLLRQIASLLGFFVVEAKSGQVELGDCLPQVLAQLYASAKKLKKTHIRGALTNGYEWLFMVLTVNPDGKGASYKASVHSYSAAPSYFGGKKVVPEDQADLIAGVLAFWIQHSCEDVGEDDWFTLEPQDT